MKEPKYIGIKKGYDAVFVAWPKDERLFEIFPESHRMRVQDDKGIWHWWDGMDMERGSLHCYANPRPCWLDEEGRHCDVTKMKQFDRAWGRVTVFLGYVKRG